jgi:ribonuclease R
MPSKTLAERIIKFVQAKGYRPQQLEQLARAMGIGEDEQGDFHAACKALMKTGRIVLGSRNALMLPDPPGKIIGTFRANPRGFGFVIPDTPNSHGDLYVPAGATGGAITGDTVSAKVKKRGKRAGKMLYEGRIVAVLSRGQSRFVGELCRQFKRWFVIPDGNTLHVPIIVGDPGAKSAKVGDQVVVEVVEYPDGYTEARGVIVKVLGKRGLPGVDTLSIIEQFQLPGEFDEAVLQDAREVVASYDPKAQAKHREDLRKLTVITIDPPDAKDFDDAISLTSRRDGSVELGIHIADVASFVRPAGPLNREARARSNSVYLPNTVIPMLPEVLSNGVCSLQERQPRLTKSVFITYDRRGKVKKTRTANSIIRSAKRLTYEQATAVLDGKPGRISAKVVALLKDMEKLARLIQARRLREGMLELDLPEVELVYDQEGAVVNAVPADQSFSHKIIEMFMVEANEAVAGVLASYDIPYLRRIHDEPTGMAGGVLRRFLRILGKDLSTDADRFALQALLDRVKGKPESFAVNLAVLRSMQQAEYLPTRIGHYALASENYCHFTSPIRRYPDLSIHRLLDLHLAGALKKRTTRKQIPTEEQLEDLGGLCSANERRAEAAERELKLVLVLRLLEARLGDEFDGIVTGVANVGVFVQLERYLVEGLLPFDRLIDDWWELDPTHGAVIGQRSGRQITVGDRLRVVISKVHIPTRQLELALTQPVKVSDRAKESKPHRKPKRTGRTTRRRTVKPRRRAK